MRDIITLKGVRFVKEWSNFTGRVTRYANAGSRYFVVILSPADAYRLTLAGVIVHQTPKGETVKVGIPQVHNEVPVNAATVWGTYKDATGRVFDIFDDTLSGLDGIDNFTGDVDLLLWPWEFQGRTGVKPYLQNLSLTFE